MPKIYMNELEMLVALGYISSSVEGLSSLRDGKQGKRRALLRSCGKKATWADVQAARENLLRKLMDNLPED